MAKVISCESGVKRQYNVKKRASFFMAVLFLALLIIMSVGVLKYGVTDTRFIGGCTIGAFFSALFSFLFARGLSRLHAGVFGEHKTEKILSKLPDDYFVITNVTVSYNHKKSEIDAVVVSSRGVFIVETKYSAGEIKGRYTDKKLEQKKVTDAGNVYRKKLYNPVKQVGTHIYRLANFLRVRGINTYVRGAVYFSNEEAELKIKNIDFDAIPVFAKSEGGEDKLLGRIKMQNEPPLSQKSVEKIISLLS